MTDTESGLWWRNRWMEAVYSSSLKPLERFVATVFADHASSTVSQSRARVPSGKPAAQCWRWPGKLYFATAKSAKMFSGFYLRLLTSQQAAAISGSPTEPQKAEGADDACAPAARVHCHGHCARRRGSGS